MTVSVLVLRYVAFAVIAAAANLMAQRLVLHGYFLDATLIHAMVAGTVVGLVVKYLLDKRWIFHDQSTGVAAHGRRFSLYTLMGIVTTLLFWGVEAAFWHVGRSEMARESGAALGLGLGYLLKYHLDRRFVFSAAAVDGDPA